MTILLLAALLPPLFLMIKIYKLDKVEKEPGGLIVKLCYEVTVVKRRLQESFFSRHGTFVFS